MKRIGIIGGGQLGLMIAQQAKVLGAEVIALDPAADAPAFKECTKSIVAAYDDVTALRELCSQVDVVTYEFENIPATVLIPLCEEFNIKQGFKPLLDSQDRLHEKRNAQQHGLKTPDFEAVDDNESLLKAVERLGYPSVLKSRTMGYDGHGQLVLRSEADLEKAQQMLSVPLILEAFVPFDYEVSTVVVASDDESVVFPIGRNVHRDGILDLSIVPAEGLSAELREKVCQQSRQFMEACGYRGILAIEYFVCGDEVIFNEMAPRPHNSGHYTIEGCTTNQFRELVRYLLDMPLVEPELVAEHVIMKNILGEDLEAAEAIAKEGHEGVYVNIYGKSISKPKRKMGHITFVGLNAEEYAERWADRFVK